MNDHAKRGQDRLDRLAKLPKLLQDAPAPIAQVVQREKPRTEADALREIGEQRKAHAIEAEKKAIEREEILRLHKELGPLSEAERSHLCDATNRPVRSSAAEPIEHMRGSGPMPRLHKAPPSPELSQQERHFAVMDVLLPLDCELFELTEVGAKHWLVLDGWTLAEAALLLCGANPKKIGEFDADPGVPKPDFTTAGYMGIFDRLTRAAEMGFLTFPAAPADVVQWAAKKHGVPLVLLSSMPATLAPSPELAPPAKGEPVAVSPSDEGVGGSATEEGRSSLTALGKDEHYIYDLAELGAERARHWLSMGCWNRLEAEFLLACIDPGLVQRDLARNSGRLNVGSMETHEEISKLLVSAEVAGELKFPAPPAAVIAWAMGKAMRLPKFFIPDGAYVANGRWHQGPRARAHFVEPQAATQPRYIAGRRLWELPEAIEHIAAMPAFGVPATALTERVQSDAEKGKMTLRDLVHGAEIQSDGMALFLRMSLYAEDFNAWLGAAGYPEPYRLPTVDAVTSLVMSGAPGQSLGGEAATLPDWQLNKPADVTPAAPAKDGAARGWQEIAQPYMIEKLKADRFSTAKEFDRALIACAGEPESPFDVGTGTVNRGLLVLRETGKKLELKTIQNHWGRLRGLAGLA
ncbi:MAG: hypothetical protein IV107_08060 [Paucibacter sp.]|nr:hypothetical protein [Roseateles sp.]